MNEKFGIYGEKNYQTHNQTLKVNTTRMTKRGLAAMFRAAPSSPILRQVYRLNLISGTPKTAYRLGPEVKKVELFVISKNAYGPTAGLKKFWREYLPTLKFHNDDVNFVVTRIRPETKEEIKKVPSKIVVYDANNKETTIDCLGKHSSNIFRQLKKATNATPVPESEIETIKL